MLTNALVNDIAFKVLDHHGDDAHLDHACASLFKPDFSWVTWQGILLAIPAILLGFMINFLLSRPITSLAPSGPRASIRCTSSITRSSFCSPGNSCRCN
jgi:hypothetical protein